MAKKAKTKTSKKPTKKAVTKKTAVKRVTKPKKVEIIRKKAKPTKKITAITTKTKKSTFALLASADKATTIVSPEISFLSDLLEKMVMTKNNYDLRSQIFLAISSLIFIFSIGSIMSDTQKGVIGFLVIALASLVSSVLSLYSVITPYLFQDDETKNSLMNHGYLSQFTQAAAIKKLTDVAQNREKIIQQYTIEIYNIARNSIVIKKKFNRRAAASLIWGLVIGFILIIFLP